MQLIITMYNIAMYFIYAYICMYVIMLHTYVCTGNYMYLKVV